MRRNIELYIGERRADIDAAALILFNYRFEDLGNPTAVRNSYSQTVTLPGTDANNALFGQYFRSDRQTAGGGFDAKRKTPFRIYADGDLLESGYCKLEQVQTEGGRVRSYGVGLYGGLGSFFYALSYDADGNKRTLADLVYPYNLEFIINRYTVADAWAHLTAAPYQPRARWDIVNFAPCYNGIPTDDFDADKMLVYPAAVGLPTQQADGDKTYSPKGGSNGPALVKLGRKVNEWEAHDLRSYLQRAVLRFRAFLDAVCDPAQNGGFTVELDPTFFNDDNAYYDRLWLTLPQIHKLNGLTDGGDGTFEIDAEGLEDFEASVDLSLPFGVDVTAEAGAVLGAELEDAYSGDTLFASRLVLPAETVRHEAVAWLVQLVGYDSNGAAVAGSTTDIVQTPVDGMRWAAVTVVQKFAGYISDYNGGFDGQNLDGQFVKTGGAWRWSKDIRLSLKGRNVTRLALKVQSVALAWDATADVDGLTVRGIDDGTINLWEAQTANPGVSHKLEAVTLAGIAGANTYEYSKAGAVRSGATITQRALLSTDYTPAEYLTAFAKLFGLQFVSSKDGGTISIMTRDTFFAKYAGAPVDLSARVDLSQVKSATPFTFATKWIELSFEEDEVEWAKQYVEAYGRKYGAARINTGYEFNSETEELLEGIPFKGGVEVLERSKMYNNVTQAGKAVPSAFLDSGEYELYNGDDAKSFPLTVPTAAAEISYWNDVYLSYDRYSKAQYHGADQKELDLRDSLLFYRGTVTQDAKLWKEGGFYRLLLSDDDATMAALNDNTACWNGRQDGGTPVPNFPLFGRYIYSGDTIVRSLDFSMPAEIDIPGVTFAPEAGIYERFWRRYLLDRYDDDARILRCWVDLSGLEVGPELLRRFFWWDGAIWSLNAIENHSLTTADPTQCEFVKVLDINNYTNGQAPEGSAITAYPTVLALDPYGATETLSVTADGAWTVAAVDLPGVTLSRTAGTGSGTLTVTAPANSGAALSGALVFTLTETGATARVAVTQEVGEWGISVEELEFLAAGYLLGDEAEIEITLPGANGYFNFNRSNNFCLLYDAETGAQIMGNHQTTRRVIVVPFNNTGQTERTMSVTFSFFTGDGTYLGAKNLNIRQTGETYYVTTGDAPTSYSRLLDEDGIPVLEFYTYPNSQSFKVLWNLKVFTNDTTANFSLKNGTNYETNPNYAPARAIFNDRPEVYEIEAFAVSNPSSGSSANLESGFNISDTDAVGVFKGLVVNQPSSGLVSLFTRVSLRSYDGNRSIYTPVPTDGGTKDASILRLRIKATANTEAVTISVNPSLITGIVHGVQDGQWTSGEGSLKQDVTGRANRFWYVAEVDPSDGRLVKPTYPSFYLIRLNGIYLPLNVSSRPTYGQTESLLEVLLRVNNTGAERTIRLALFTGEIVGNRIEGGAVALLTLVQRYNYFGLEPAAAQFTAAGGTIDLSLRYEGDVSPANMVIENDLTWVTAEIVNNTALRLVATANSAAARSGNVYLRDRATNETKIIPVSQPAPSWSAPASVEVSPAGSTSRVYISVSIDGPRSYNRFQFRDDVSWLRLRPQSPSETDDYDLPYFWPAENNTGATRTAVVTLYNTVDGSSKQITFTQEPNS